MKAQLIGFLAIASASTLSSPTSSDLADDNSETSDHQGMEQKRRRLGLSRQEARAAKVEDIMWSGSPSADGVHSTAPPPNAGPVEGVSYWDWETIDFFTDRTRGEGTLSGPCLMRRCDGIDFVAAIQRDLQPWRMRGGIAISDVDAAARAIPKEALRITILDGELYASGFGLGWGVRDGQWLMLLLEMMEHHKWMFPERVDFVLNTNDRAHLPRNATYAASSSSSSSVKNTRGPPPLPFALSFAQHADYLDVAIPDPSLWSWPENLIRPYWQLLASTETRQMFNSRIDKAFWRGGVGKNDATRAALLQCPSSSSARKSASALGEEAFDFAHAVRTWPESWTPATEICRYKYGIVTASSSSSTTSSSATFSSSSSQNSYTSAIARALACGNVPLLVGEPLAAPASEAPTTAAAAPAPEVGAHAPYYARWLRQNYHFLHVRTGSSSSTGAGAGAGAEGAHQSQDPLMCSDLSRAITWARAHRDEATAIASAARRFATNVLGPRIVHEYLLTVLSEVSRLQALHTSRYPYGLAAGQPGMVKVTKDNLGQLFERSSRGKSGVLAATAAYWHGTPCPVDKCPLCCVLAPTSAKASRRNAGQPLSSSLIAHSSARIARSQQDLMRHDLMMLSTGGSMAGVASSALLGKPLGKQWFEQSKKKKWSPANKTRAFKRSQEAASKFY